MEKFPRFMYAINIFPVSGWNLSLSLSIFRQCRCTMALSENCIVVCWINIIITMMIHLLLLLLLLLNSKHLFCWFGVFAIFHTMVYWKAYVDFWTCSLQFFSSALNQPHVAAMDDFQFCGCFVYVTGISQMYPAFRILFVNINSF